MVDGVVNSVNWISYSMNTERGHTVVRAQGEGETAGEGQGRGTDSVSRRENGPGSRDGTTSA